MRRAASATASSIQLDGGAHQPDLARQQPESPREGELVGQAQPVRAHRVVVQQDREFGAGQVDEDDPPRLRPGHAHGVGQDQPVRAGKVIEERRRPDVEIHDVDASRPPVPQVCAEAGAEGIVPRPAVAAGRDQRPLHDYPFHSRVNSRKCTEQLMHGS